MRRASRRYFAYGAVGMLFGLVVWFTLTFLNWYAPANVIGSGPWWRPPKALINYPLLYDLVSDWLMFFLWLVPVLPIIVIETRASRRPELAALAVTLCWVAALVAYYAIYAGWLLLGLGGPQLGVRLDQGWEAWWRGVVALRIHQMVGHDFLLYTAIALVGGPIVGWLGGQGMLLLARCWHALRPPRLHAEH